MVVLRCKKLNYVVHLQVLYDFNAFPSLKSEVWFQNPLWDLLCYSYPRIEYMHTLIPAFMVCYQVKVEIQMLATSLAVTKPETKVNNQHNIWFYPANMKYVC